MNTSVNLIEFLIQDLAVVLIAAGCFGWLCKRLGISVIVGYLAAGIIVGTPQVTFAYVTDMDRIQLLAQLGLIFLMFFIGLGLRVRKLKELGLGVVLATVVTAIGTLTVARFSALLFGFDEATALFLAAMLMVSSSAIVGKLLQDNNLVHQRAGQLALAITLLEDIVAIVLLGYLGSYVAAEQAVGGGMGAIFKMVGLLIAFVVLILLPGIVFLPRWLHRFEQRGGIELETLIVAGLLFAMAWFTLSAGFSIALGAFLCGVILAETERVEAIERAFSGLKDIFVAVFFTAIGMVIDITRLPEALGLIVLGVALAFVVRILAAMIGLLLACEDEEAALKAACCITPIGEFSFVIAGIGVASGVLDGTMQIAAVGISFITSLTSPFLLRHIDQVSRFLRPSRVPLLGRGLEFYRKCWLDFSKRTEGIVVWRLLRPRFWQIGAELLLVTALLLFAKPGEVKFVSWAESTVTWLPFKELFYWLFIALIVLGPIIALYRNVAAMSLLLADFATAEIKGHSIKKRSFEWILRTVGFGLISVWLFNLLPFGQLNLAEWVLFSGIVGALAFFGWRRWVRWHSHAEFSINAAFAEVPEALDDTTESWKRTTEAFGLNLVEATVPPQSSLIGKTLIEANLRRLFGVTVIAMDRQGFFIGEITASQRLFYGDLLYLVGTDEGLSHARALIESVAVDQGGRAAISPLSSAILSRIKLSDQAKWIGSSLAELNWSNQYKVQIVAVNQAEGLLREFGPDLVLRAGDELVVAGSTRAIQGLMSS
jgi:CPA2 family monovalent cation:H+ antiporter-2